jgi:hypothetical protein
LGWLLERKAFGNKQHTEDSAESSGPPFVHFIHGFLAVPFPQGQARNLDGWVIGLGSGLRARHRLYPSESLLEVVCALSESGDGMAISLSSEAISVTGLNDLASQYGGCYKDAKPLCRQAMEIHRRTLGEQQPDFATSLNNLARLIDSMGCFDDAEPLYR